MGFYVRQPPPPNLPHDFLGWGARVADGEVMLGPNSDDSLQAFEGEQDTDENSAIQPFKARALAAQIAVTCESSTGEMADALENVGKAADLVVMGHGLADSSLLLSEAGEL